MYFFSYYNPYPLVHIDDKQEYCTSTRIVIVKFMTSGPDNFVLRSDRIYLHCENEIFSFKIFFATSTSGHIWKQNEKIVMIS